MKAHRSLSSWQPSRRTGIVLGAGLGAALGLMFWTAGMGSGLSDRSYDLLYLARPSIEVHGAVMVLMDDSSYGELTQSREGVWDRSLHADLIRRLASSGARAVVFDVLFQNPGTNDGPFLEAIRNATRVHTAVLVAAKRVDGGLGQKPVPLLPFAALRDVAAVGLAEHELEDEVMRRHYVGLPDLPTLAWRAAELTVSNLPVNAASPRWINYYGPARRSIPSYSYVQVWRGEVPAQAFSNQVVFVGSSVDVGTAAGRRPDTWPTPYRVKAPGVEINATVYLNLQRGDWLERIPAGAELVLLLGLGALFGGGFLLCRPLTTAVLAVGSMAGLAGVACWLAWGAGAHGLWFSWLVPAAVQVPFTALWSILGRTQRLLVEKELLEDKIAALEPALALAGGRVDPTLDADTAGLVPTTVGTSAPVRMPPSRVEGVPGAPAVPDHALLRCVGKGAYGEVWLARNAVGIFHAVKVVSGAGFANSDPFEREFRGIQKFMPISRLHPGLVQILQVGRHETAGYFYYVMEPADDEIGGTQFEAPAYVPKTLARELDRRGKLPAAECLEVGLALASALDFLHSHQLIHRDIKPANIIYVRGAPKLADIGLVTGVAATHTKATYLGTEGYIAPEGPGQPAADVYSLGRVLYQAVMGLKLDQFPELPATLLHRPDRELALELNQIILRACEGEPTRRYPTAAALHADLEQLKRQKLDSPPPGG